MKNNPVVQQGTVRLREHIPSMGYEYGGPQEVNSKGVYFSGCFLQGVCGMMYYNARYSGAASTNSVHGVPRLDGWCTG